MVCTEVSDDINWYISAKDCLKKSGIWYVLAGRLLVQGGYQDFSGIFYLVYVLFWFYSSRRVAYICYIL